MKKNRHVEIELILGALNEIWQLCPDLRFSQLISKAINLSENLPENSEEDVFQLEDAGILYGIRRLKDKLVIDQKYATAD